MRTKAKSGFTIVELLTVISLILLLMGAVTASVTGARRRARIQQAITEAQQLTDAILGYENYARPGSPSPLEDRKTDASWKEATEDDLNFVLGKATRPDGSGQMPVLYNGAVKGGKIRDPWGNPYRYRILSSSVNADDDSAGDQGEAAFAFPNINRIPADEVN